MGSSYAMVPIAIQSVSGQELLLEAQRQVRDKRRQRMVALA